MAGVPDARSCGCLSRRCLLTLAALAALPVAAPPNAVAQAPESGATAAKPLPKPEDVKLTTKDGVQLVATYYPATLGQESPVVILLHGFQGDRHEFSRLARALQRSGAAVIAPDLRGHGDSTRLVGSDAMLSADRLTNPQFAAMVSQDLEAVKTHLMQRNNAGELNIEKLSVLGCEMGALVAANWALLDWSWPPLAVGKQGQDVKALALISPPNVFKGLRINGPLDAPVIRNEMPLMIAAGKEDRETFANAEAIFKRLDRVRVKPLRPDEHTLVSYALPTRLQGSKLLVDEEMGLNEAIVDFVATRVANRNFPWRDRPNPLN